MIGKKNEIMLRNKADEIIIECFDDIRITNDDSYVFIDVERLASNIADDLTNTITKTIEEDEIDCAVDETLLAIFCIVRDEVHEHLFRNFNIKTTYEVRRN